MSTLHLTTGLPGAGKTTVARSIETSVVAVRLTPDDWLLPMFGHAEPTGVRDVLEGRMLWLAHRTLLAGADVVVDFGCWAAEERHAIRVIAELAGADHQLHFVDVEESVRRRRAAARFATDPGAELPMTDEDHDRAEALFQRPSARELAGAPVPSPPTGHLTWTAWAADRWPSLPDLGRTAASDGSASPFRR